MKSTGKIRNPKVEVKTIEPTKVESILNPKFDSKYNTVTGTLTLNPESFYVGNGIVPLEGGFCISATRPQLSFNKEYQEALAVEIKKETDKIIDKLDDFIEMRIKQATEKLTEQLTFLQKEVFKLNLNANKTTVSLGFIDEAWSGPYTITPLPLNPCSIVKDSNNS